MRETGKKAQTTLCAVTMVTIASHIYLFSHTTNGSTPFQDNTEERDIRTPRAFVANTKKKFNNISQNFLLNEAAMSFELVLIAL